MTPMIVGISDCRVTNDRNAVLTTYALGSCVAVAVHDPVSFVGGLLHYMLPEASLDRAKAESNPYMFADTGIKELIQRVCDGGANRRRLVVRIAGGALSLTAGAPRRRGVAYRDAGGRRGPGRSARIR